MMTALLILLGLSACSTAMILAAVMVGARRGMVPESAPATARESSRELSRNLAFSH